MLDFSAFVAGPLAAEVLADLGAEVVKVEPPGGEAMRGAAYAIAACQRGKRSLAMDIGAAEARPVVERLIAWADVVLHNFRVGVSERLGIDEASVARLNPDAVYCHASAFGTTGPRAKAPGNDALMQALTGFARANGGAGNDPVLATWIPIDITGAWVAAAGILAGLYARATSGRGQRVVTILLGAGMLLHSGVFRRDGRVVRGPELDAGQTGYGPGYRLYRAGDGDWLALVVPDPEAWARLRALPEAGGAARGLCPAAPRAGRHRGPGGRGRPGGGVRHRGAAEWVGRLRALGLPAERVAALDRDGFRRGILDDPVNRQLGRVAPTRPPTGATSSRSARCCVAAPRPRRAGPHAPRGGRAQHGHPGRPRLRPRGDRRAAGGQGGPPGPLSTGAPAGGPAAVDDDGLAGHVAARVARQPQHRADHVVRPRRRRGGACCGAASRGCARRRRGRR